MNKIATTLLFSTVIIVSAVIIAREQDVFGAILNTSSAEIFNDTKTQETQDFSSTGKYKHIKKEKIDDVYSRTVNEYKTPEGQVGWQVIVWKDIADDGLYMMSKGEGAESTNRNFDWRKIKDYTASTTNEQL